MRNFEIGRMPPSLKEWKQLYEAAAAFKQEAPWEWMGDTDIFGVQNPRDGEVGYCCILGRAGDILGMAIYLGTEGLEGFLKLMNRKKDAGYDDDIMHVNKCLLVSFEDKSGLEKADKEILRDLGLEFNGRDAWPLFRSYLPGYLPWHLNKEQAVFMAVCLRQAIEVVLQYKGNPGFFSVVNEKNYFVRVQDKEHPENGWKNYQIAPLPLHKVLVVSKKLDRTRIEKIKRASKCLRQTWEIDSFYSPAYIAEEGKRPYYPVTFIFVEANSFFILNAHVTTIEKYRLEFDEKLLETIEQTKVIPDEILVNKEETAFLLEKPAEALGINVRVVKNLPAASDVRKEMFNAFRRSK